MKALISDLIDDFSWVNINYKKERKKEELSVTL